MEMKHVDSSQINRIGYYEEERVLVIEFKDRHGNPTATWEYLNVPILEYRALMNADSIGKYFNRNIKGQYSGRKVS